MFRKLFEEALEKEAQKRDVFINEFRISSDSHEELFSSYNIPYDEIISFSASSDVGGENLEMPAFTNFFLNDGDAQAAIFIKDTFFEEDDEYNHLWKYIMLIHEIGHVNDFRKSKYLNWKKRECNIVMAESFAEIYSIKYFSRRDDQYHRLCRALLAQRILGFENYGNVYKSIFQQILKTYPRKKLIQWSSST
ncbi:hypothetical protein BST55_24170 [Vibrio vulnificus]|uniref:hypothetical protein n=1 Tax=Vibrio vulnificus TaxID=672 RepID=UPI000BA11CD2|nr:hypothetical protein [Vibrio vulnificus]EGR8992436.1 hypothetical protein [Vibrio vulnificus]MCU8566989.1 hypothetical protein [Vibrio vulnificus]OZS50781.1 hypothetical protein BST51_24140 [Vibrio vulnificus]OZS55674.1 hypothetical protein BST52_22305 [Vibrio vulnificus]OZS60038.1 hypothetical protein BST56_24160 [Vibrio vulnificus]